MASLLHALFILFGRGIRRPFSNEQENFVLKSFKDKKNMNLKHSFNSFTRKIVADASSATVV